METIKNLSFADGLRKIFIDGFKPELSQEDINKLKMFCLVEEISKTKTFRLGKQED